MMFDEVMHAYRCTYGYNIAACCPCHPSPCSPTQARGRGWPAASVPRGVENKAACSLSQQETIIPTSTLLFYFHLSIKHGSKRVADSAVNQEQSPPKNRPTTTKEERIYIISHRSSTISSCNSAQQLLAAGYSGHSYTCAYTLSPHQ